MYVIREPFMIVLSFFCNAYMYMYMYCTWCYVFMYTEMVINLVQLLNVQILKVYISLSLPLSLSLSLSLSPLSLSSSLISWPSLQLHGGLLRWHSNEKSEIVRRRVLLLLYLLRAPFYDRYTKSAVLLYCLCLF